MAKLSPTKMDINRINGGNEYTNADGLQAETINAVVESGAWVQALATNTPDTSNANKVGTPSVTIDQSGNTPKFVFAYLKGDTGRAAGFGTPSATASSLDAGSTPTVSVSVEGENTAKIFKFSFGIPKGETYTLTDTDKQTIANIVYGMLPFYEGETS